MCRMWVRNDFGRQLRSLGSGAGDNYDCDSGRAIGDAANIRRNPHVNANLSQEHSSLFEQQQVQESPNPNNLIRY